MRFPIEKFSAVVASLVLLTQSCEAALRKAKINGDKDVEFNAISNLQSFDDVRDFVKQASGQGSALPGYESAKTSKKEASLSGRDLVNDSYKVMEVIGFPCRISWWFQNESPEAYLEGMKTDYVDKYPLANQVVMSYLSGLNQDLLTKNPNNPYLKAGQVLGALTFYIDNPGVANDQELQNVLEFKFAAEYDSKNYQAMLQSLKGSGKLALASFIESVVALDINKFLALTNAENIGEIQNPNHLKNESGLVNEANAILDAMNKLAEQAAAKYPAPTKAPGSGRRN